MPSIFFTILGGLIVAASPAWSAPAALMTAVTETGFRADETQIRIYEDGRVEASQPNAPSPQVTATLAVLSPAVTQQLQKRIDSLAVPLALMDPNPRGLTCMNTLTTRMTVHQSQGANVLIKTMAGCHVHVPSTATAAELAQILETFMALGRLP